MVGCKNPFYDLYPVSVKFQLQNYEREVVFASNVVMMQCTRKRESFKIIIGYSEVGFLNSDPITR
jgi:hypothetical protein